MKELATNVWDADCDGRDRTKVHRSVLAITVEMLLHSFFYKEHKDKAHFCSKFKNEIRTVPAWHEQDN